MQGAFSDMPHSTQELKAIIDGLAENAARHQEWIGDVDGRLRKIELAHAKMMGIIVAVQVGGGLVGTGLALFISHYWGK